jgi:hypothetical protein
MSLYIAPDRSSHMDTYEIEITITDSDSEKSGESEELVGSFKLKVGGVVEEDDGEDAVFDYSSLLTS